MLHETIVSECRIGQVTPDRSRRSHAFEEFWRALPRTGSLPRRSDMGIKQAAPFLQHMMLVEARLNDTPSFPIRLTGGAVRDRIQRDIVGHDYLEFLPRQYHAGAIETARLVTGFPCGLWQIMALHFERGFAQNHEVTAFPLETQQGEPPLLLGLFEPAEGLIAAHPAHGKAMLADTASTFRFIDIGAGEPAWLAA
jgi:hypothetical protein